MEQGLTFCDILKSIRKKEGYTQEKLSDGICSLRQYKRIEAGLSVPSAYMLDLLSYKLNLDLNHIYRLCSQHNHAELYRIKMELNTALSNNDDTTLRHLLEEAQKHEKFYDNDFRMIVCYVRAILNRHDSETGIQYAMDGLYIENPKFTLENPQIHTNTGLSLMNYLALCHKKAGNSSDSKKIFEYLISKVELYKKIGANFYESSTYVNSFYPKVLSSYIALTISEKDYSKALTLADEGLSFLTSHNCIKYTYLLLWHKVVVHCLLADCNEATHTFIQLCSICELLGKTTYLSAKLEIIEKDYPQLVHFLPEAFQQYISLYKK